MSARSTNRRRARRRAAALMSAALMSAACLAGAGMLAQPVAAHASPLDPGFFGPNSPYALPLCSIPRAVPSLPGWTRVLCAVGARQFVVPPNVHVLQVAVVGAAGGPGGGGAPGGRGDAIHASIVVAPGELLELAVGGAGDRHEDGGFNGGGDGAHPGATGVTAAGGGGGTSDIRVGDGSAWTRILSAGGGGGGGGGGAGSGRAPGGAGGSSGRAGQYGPGALGGAPGQPATSRGSGAGGGTGAAAGAAGSTSTLIGGAGGPGTGGAPGAAPGAGDGGSGGGGYGFGGGGAGGTSTTGATGATDTTGPTGGGGGGGGGSSFIEPAALQPGVPVTSAPGVGVGSGSISVTFHAPPIQCGQTIFASMTLTSDLDCRGTAGLTLGGSLVEPLEGPAFVFDLGGHTVRGDATETGFDIRQNPVTVRNGTLRGFGVGVSAHELDSFDHEGADDAFPTLSHLHLTGGVDGVEIGGRAGQVFIDQTTITAMSDAGIRAADANEFFDRLYLTDSTIRRSTTGVFADGIGSLVMRNDVVSGNIESGVDVAGTQITLNDNTVSANGGVGMRVRSESYDESDDQPIDPGELAIGGNHVTGNQGSGISLSGRIGAGDDLADNLVEGNGHGGAAGDPGDGITVDLGTSAAGLTVDQDAAIANHGSGIDAAGVVDGGGNVAYDNGTDGCTGVSCARNPAS